jgi:hypothetical protein
VYLVSVTLVLVGRTFIHQSSACSWGHESCAVVALWEGMDVVGFFPSVV